VHDGRERLGVTTEEARKQCGVFLGIARTVHFGHGGSLSTARLPASIER
jgi:hypothetical protein